MNSRLPQSLSRAIGIVSLVLLFIAAVLVVPAALPG
jgi:hypothetical protein